MKIALGSIILDSCTVVLDRQSKLAQPSQESDLDIALCMGLDSKPRLALLSRHTSRIVCICTTLLFLLSLPPSAICIDGAPIEKHWVGSWATSQQLVEPENALHTDDLRDATLRQIVPLSLGGNEMRLRVSNRFGSTPLHLTDVHAARSLSPRSDKIVAGTDVAVTFSGLADVTIPPHADYVSDPVLFSAAPLSDVAITLHIDAPPDAQTGHSGSRATSYFTHGDSAFALELPGAKTCEHWYFIAGIDVVASAQASAVVVLGDSITDGHGATTNGNDRWPDILSQRLQSQPGTKNVAVLNQGIGGNHILTDGLGPNALSRFDHDVIAQPGVRYLIVLEGINDIGKLAREGGVSRTKHNALVQQIIAAYQQMIARSHTHALKVVGATITAFVGSEYYHPAPANEADRQAVNEWIRTPGHFDAVIDFDEVTRDPEQPDRLLPAFDSGDHLHPSPAGYAAMGRAVPLALFLPDPAPKIAFTFDDLPAHGSLPSGVMRLDVITKIITAMRDAKLPPVYGFVNGARIDEHPADAAVLEAWRAAGNPLANHTWSHMNLNEHTIEQVEQDIVRNEPLLAASMKEQDWHWFRYPFLAEGEATAERNTVRSYLRDHGYKIAAVTMSFGDYQWNEPYARCKAKSATAAIEILQDTYLSAAGESADYYRSLPHTLYHRDIPYVLLMHVGAFDAEMLPQLIGLYRDIGFEFVTLPEAESDEFYRSSIEASRSGDPETLEMALAQRRLSSPARKDYAAQLDSLCR